MEHKQAWIDPHSGYNPQNDHSQLADKFGVEVPNFFSASPLNRVSFLRERADFLETAFYHPSARFMLITELKPVVGADGSLLMLKTADIKELVGDMNPVLYPEDKVMGHFDSRNSFPLVIFLGLDPAAEGLVFEKQYSGVPYFAIDITPRDGYKDQASHFLAHLLAQGNTIDPERVPSKLSMAQLAMFGTARHTAEWNNRNKFCSQCGNRTVPACGAFKRNCPGQDKAFPDRAPNECLTRVTNSNVSFPRLDPTVITAVVSADGKKVLIGHSKKHSSRLYSCVAGYMEPGESIEEAARREVWEESGVHLGRVVIHSSQPWPYPACLMIGTIGQALPDGESIYLDHDKELADAKWFTMDEIKESLAKTALHVKQPEQKNGAVSPENAFRLPSKMAIANTLLAVIVDGYTDSGFQL